MDKLVESLVKEFSKHGLIGLLLLTVLSTIYITIKSEWFGKLFSKISDRFIEYFMKRKVGSDSGIKLITESDILPRYVIKKSGKI